MRTARVELLDANDYVIAYDDQWELHGTELHFTGGDRPVLLASIISKMKMHADQYLFDLDPPPNLKGVAVNTAMVLNLAFCVIKFHAPWDTILGLTEEMPTWG
jgi:hypothetical protein